MPDRKKFLQQVAMLTSAFSANSLFSKLHATEISTANKRVSQFSPAELAADEDYWGIIQQAYSVSATIINLNNGGVSPSPKFVQDAVDRYNKLSNEGPSYYIQRFREKNFLKCEISNGIGTFSL